MEISRFLLRWCIKHIVYRGQVGRTSFACLMRRHGRNSGQSTCRDTRVHGQFSPRNSRAHGGSVLSHRWLAHIIHWLIVEMGKIPP
jgi:hypothetical protein